MICLVIEIANLFSHVGIRSPSKPFVCVLSPNNFLGLEAQKWNKIQMWGSLNLFTFIQKPYLEFNRKFI